MLRKTTRSKFFYIFLFLLSIILAELIFLNIKTVNFSDKELTRCKTLNDTSQKLQCWENLIDSTLKVEGIDQAFYVLENLYQTEPEFMNACHDYSHKIGETAFKLFSTNQKEQTLSPKSFYCGYGYYHGFMDAMLHTTGTLNQAREFCKYAGEKLAKQNNDAEGTCYHGIGHGVVDGSDPRAEGNAEAIIKPGLELCQQVAPTEILLNRCSSGVFNSLAIILNGNEHKLSVSKTDPMWICQKQTNPIFKKTCYEEMNTLLLPLEGGDFRKAVLWIKQITDEENAISAMDSLAQFAASYRQKNSGQTEFIKVCQEWPDKFRSACIGGFSAGILLFGTPGIEYQEGIQFCNSTLLSEADHDACLNRFLWSIYLAYPEEKFRSICQSLGEADRKYCSNLLKN